MEKQYDVILVGAGPTGIFAAYELMLKAPNLKVLLIDKGPDIYNRKCPILLKKIDKCPKNKKGNAGCFPACSMTSGFGGCGAYSDGKFNITSEFGGWMTDYLPEEEVIELIKYVDQINLNHGAPKEITDPHTQEVFDIEKRAAAVGLKLLRSEVRHLGTEINLKVLENIFEEMKPHIDYAFATDVSDIIVEDGKVVGIVLSNGEEVKTRYLQLGVGRSGSKWLSSTLSMHGVEFTNNKVDVGVRVETNNIIMDEINRNLYEGKFIFNTSVGTTVRTFCSNPSGHVVVENHNGVMVCNGHSFSDEKLGSKNTNFALLVSNEFEDPFNDPNRYAEEISKLANRLSNGGVIVQKYGDILKGRRSTRKRINEGFVKPTLKEAIPGDLGLALPYNIMKSLIEMMEALNYITPGIASDHTLFYGVEAKFYSDRPKVNSNFETKITNLYVGGDGAGITRGLAQAGANGVKIARAIIEKENK
ncbi:MAG: NAD(P)/FAD-dependent oxidoreductase [Bacilli bacterium]|nr:NAD(P)/FAD-dependent oxidoreductase [Bacilli bacterium]